MYPKKGHHIPLQRFCGFYFKYMSKVKRNKILVLYVGGAKESFANRDELQEWFKDFSEIQMIADTEIVPIQLQATERLRLFYLQRVVRRIMKEWKNFDSFIITFPYELYLYYANVLSFMMGNSVEKPIICTTALRFTNIQNNSIKDAYLNCVNAAIIANTGIAGVFVIGGREVLPAAHAVHTIQNDLDIVESADGVQLGLIDFGITLDMSTHIGSGKKPNPNIDIAQNIEWIDLENKETQQENIARMRALQHLDAMIVNIGSTMDIVITREFPKKVPIILMTKEYAFLYEKSRVTPIHEMTPVTAAGKLTWILGQQKRRGPLKRFLEKEYIGEFLQMV